MNKIDWDYFLGTTPNNTPLVSIIVPTYNRPDFLALNLKTLLKQTYTNIEIIVVNDAGEDVEYVISNINDDRITYVANDKNMGLGASRNVGIKNSNGEWLCFIDDDDGAYPFHVQTLVNYAQKSNAKAIYTDAVRLKQERKANQYVITGQDYPYSVAFNKDLLLIQNISPVNCFMIHKSIFDDVGLFDEELKRYEDWDMWIRISQKYPMLHIAIPTCFYTWRDDESSMSSQRNSLFTDLLPVIYNRYKHLADNKFFVEYNQERTLKSRGL